MVAPSYSIHRIQRDEAIAKMRSVRREARAAAHRRLTGEQVLDELKEIERAARERAEQSRAKLKALGWLKEKE